MKRIGLLVVLFVVMWGVLSAGIHITTQNNNLGSDFFIYWNAGRAVMFEGANPYSDEIAMQNQMAIFKRLSGPLEDQVGFAYPPYALLLVLPMLFMPFDWAQAVWIAFLLLTLMVAGVAAMPRARRWLMASFLCFYPTFFGLILGNFAVLLSALLLLFFGIFLEHKQPSRALQMVFGFLAAWLTIKPQFLWLFLVFIGLYALRKKLWWFLCSAGVSEIIFLLLSFALVPGWPALWLERLGKYTIYLQTYPVVTYFLKDIMPLAAANLLTIALGLVFLAVTGWFFYRWWRGTQPVISLLAWLGFTVYLFHPRVVSYDHLGFLLPMLFWAGLQTTWRSLAPNLFWWGSLAASWAAFFISSQPGSPSSAAEWPLLFAAVWVGWIMSRGK